MKGHSGANSGLWGNRTYLQLKTGEKLSEKLHCDLCIPLRELYLFSHKVVFKHCSCKTEKVILCSTLKTMVKSDVSSNKTQREAFQETALDMCIHFRELKLILHCPVWTLSL